MKKRVILFDLDGTIIDSQEGIMNCIRYALEAIGKEEPDDAKLRRFIGPPLDYSFREFYGFDEETIDFLVKKYRERYNPIGAFECKLYPEVKESLTRLKQAGYAIGLASSKPEVFCKKILDYHQITDLFSVITGSDFEGGRNTKAKVLIESLHRFSAKKEEAVLIGDTRFDAEGAKEAGVSCIGITYGFGTREEMLSAGADKVFDSLKEVEAYLAAD
ncbi:MAG: HAD hydrolase-like protein [Lachnospiraceae bacterium]